MSPQHNLLLTHSPGRDVQGPRRRAAAPPPGLRRADRAVRRRAPGGAQRDVRRVLRPRVCALRGRWRRRAARRAGVCWSLLLLRSVLCVHEQGQQSARDAMYALFEGVGGDAPLAGQVRSVLTHNMQHACMHQQTCANSLLLCSPSPASTSPSPTHARLRQLLEGTSQNQSAHTHWRPAFPHTPRSPTCGSCWRARPPPSARRCCSTSRAACSRSLKRRCSRRR